MRAPNGQVQQGHPQARIGALERRAKTLGHRRNVFAGPGADELQLDRPGVALAQKQRAQDSAGTLGGVSLGVNLVRYELDQVPGEKPAIGRELSDRGDDIGCAGGGRGEPQRSWIDRHAQVGRLAGATVSAPSSSATASAPSPAAGAAPAKPQIPAIPAAPAAKDATKRATETRSQVSDIEAAQARAARERELEAKRREKAKQNECVYKPVTTDEDIAKCR